MAVALKRRLFTVDEYYRMAEAGILTADDRVELIEGEIVEMSPIGSPHAGQVNHLNSILTTRLGGRAIVSVQNPVRLSQRSEPQPDLAILRPRDDSYRRSHPGPADILLIIEVMDTTVEMDRRVKAPLYARAGVRETWLLDVNAERIEAYRAPTPEGYRDVRVLRRGESVTPEAFPDLTFSVDALIG
jgi:Uma2 family endonuclease